MILDGWGLGTNPEVSAIDNANTPFIDSLYKEYSWSKLEASGEAVGLPEGQMGNSEVGHMNIGAGRVVYQNLVRINKSFRENSIDNNQVLIEAVNYAKKENKKIHLIGLISDGGVHSHINHLKGLTSILSKHALNNVYVHAFTDGRDCDPKSGISFVRDIENHLKNTCGELVTLCGRYYAMDRDKRWERIKLAYDLMINGVGEKTNDIEKSVLKSYNEGVTDEFIKPILKIDENGHPVSQIEEGDVVINFNFRTDRGRQITEALTQKDFHEQNMHKLNLHYVTMTNYDDTFENVQVIFNDENLTNTLGEVLARNGKRQIRIAETEKYPHVTFFFNGGNEVEFDGENRILCASPKVATYDLQPEMSAECIRDKIVFELETNEPDYVCLNFANPDMVGHTGVMSAAIKACETVNNCAEVVLNKALEKGYTSIVIADHGNCDIMMNTDGSPHTAHTTNLVPCILVDKELRPSLKNGKLGDLAPTILSLMGVDIPKEMTGNILL